jgi:hypothetical protein
VVATILLHLQLVVQAVVAHGVQTELALMELRIKVLLVEVHLEAILLAQAVVAHQA